MLNDAEFSLENCSAVDPEQSGMTMQSAGAAACDNLFRFVSARDPEYYREFKKVSFNEEKKIKQNAGVEFKQSHGYYGANQIIER